MRSYLIALTFIIGSQSDSAHAQGWDITPSLGVAEIWSSNILLAEEGAEEEEYITSISPGILMSHPGERWSLDLAYMLQALYYREDGERDQSHGTARMDTHFDLVRERLLLDVTSSLSREIIDPHSPVGFNNINLTSNVTDALRYTASPQWIQPLGSTAEMSMTYERSVIDFADSGVFDYEADHYNLRLGSNEDLRSARYGWGFEYDQNKLVYEDGLTTEFVVAALSLTRDLSTNSQLVVRGGAENDLRENASEAKLDSPFWEIGIRASPSEGNDIEARVGRRYFGRVYGLAWQRTARFLRLDLDYVEEPTNFAGRFAGRQAAFTELQFLSDGTLPEVLPDVYISRRVDSQLTITTLRRLSLSFGVARERRDYIGSNEDERVTSVNAGLDISFGSSTSLLVEARRIDSEERRGDEHRRKLINVAFERTLSTRWSFNAGVTFQERATDSSTVAQGDYEETQIYLALMFNRTELGAGRF